MRRRLTLVAITLQSGATARGDRDLQPAPPADAFTSSVDSAAASLGAGLSCHGRDNYDISGDAAYVWGLNFHTTTASQCCEACAAHNANCGLENRDPKRTFWDDGGRALRCGRARGQCNAWVFCAANEQCFSYDIHKHKRGECWLKHEPNVTAPIAAGPLPLAFREAPRQQWPWPISDTIWPGQPPEKSGWQTGIVASKSATVWKFVRVPGWHRRFCNKHGPC